MSLKDKEFMQKALDLAKIAFDCNEVPIGAIVVNDKEDIIGEGYNLTEKNFNQNSHAEIIAISQAVKKNQNWRLSNCTIYITLQPCMMCMGLIFLSRIKRVVYATNSPLFGCFIDKELLPDLYKKQDCYISSGILAEKSEALMKSFFQNKRQKE